MNTSAQMANGDTSKLTSEDICLRQACAIMLLGLNRAAKRNTLDAVMIGKIQNSFQNLPEATPVRRNSLR
jgi:enoyl-CoA hydratase/carnithine racemase